MGPQFHYEVHQDRFARCAFEVADQRVEWFASSMSEDALGDLLKSFDALLCGFDAGSGTVFVDPPGYFEVALFLRPADTVRVVVSQHAHWPLRDQGEVIFDREARLRTLAGSVLATAQAVLKAEGDEGYLAKWRTPFPREALDRLKKTLESTRGE